MSSRTQPLSIRDQVRLRDGNECRACGKSVHWTLTGQVASGGRVAHLHVEFTGVEYAAVLCFECSAPGACHPSVLDRIIKENKNGFSTEATKTAPSELSPVKEVGFGVRPSFFRSQAHRLPVGPKKVAERDDVKVREKAFSEAVQTLRSAADALHRFKALDQTGQLVAGIEHLDVHINRARHAAEALQDMAEAFAKVWEL